MEVDKDTIHTVGYIATILGSISIFWWKLTSRFVKKDVLSIHLSGIDEKLKDGKTEFAKLWDVVSDIKESVCGVEGMLQVMATNKRKRKDD